MAEEFGLRELTRKRGTVHLDKRPVRSRGRRVNGPRHDVLADSAFPTEQDGRVDCGDLFDGLPDSPHLGAVAQKRGTLGEMALTECPLSVIGGLGAGTRQGRVDGGLRVDDVGAGSAIIAAVPMKACGSTTDSSWVSRTKGRTPRYVPQVATGRRSAPPRTERWLNAAFRVWSELLTFDYFCASRLLTSRGGRYREELRRSGYCGFPWATASISPTNRASSTPRALSATGPGPIGCTVPRSSR